MFSLESFFSLPYKNSFFSFGFLEKRYFLRRLFPKAVRFISRLMAGKIVAPRYSFVCISTVFFMVTGFYALYMSGRALLIMQAMVIASGLGLNQVSISGNYKTSEIEIIDRLDLASSYSLIGLNLSTMRARILDLPWVKDVSLKKIYPGMIRVNLHERTPYALWQYNGSFYLVDHSGKIIVPSRALKDDSLPFVIGAGAADAFAEFFEKIKKNKDIVHRIKSYARITNRRWDLNLDNGIVVKLPEQNPEKALFSLISMNQKSDVLKRDILSIDLRLRDNIVIRLSGNGLAQYHTALKKAGIKMSSLHEAKT